MGDLFTEGLNIKTQFRDGYCSSRHMLNYILRYYLYTNLNNYKYTIPVDRIQQFLSKDLTKRVCLNSLYLHSKKNV